MEACSETTPSLSSSPSAVAGGGGRDEASVRVGRAATRSFTSWSKRWIFFNLLAACLFLMLLQHERTRLQNRSASRKITSSPSVLL